MCTHKLLGTDTVRYVGFWKTFTLLLCGAKIHKKNEVADLKLKNEPAYLPDTVNYPLSTDRYLVFNEL